MPTPFRIAVVGAGAFGRNHLRVLHELSKSHLDGAALETDQALSGRGSKPAQLAAAVDADPATREAVASRYQIPAFATVDDLLAANLGLHAATVAVPTVAHAHIAKQLLEANLDVLVEKPLTSTLAEADALIDLARREGRILAAGHLERFNPAVTAALGRLTRPMFFEAHRLSIFTPRSLDVDVVLDLMIHDLDVVLAMAASAVTEVRAVGLAVLSPKVDIANVRLEFASGAVANFTASRVSTEQVRKLRLFQPTQYLSLDYARQELLTINVDPAAALLSRRVPEQSALANASSEAASQRYNPTTPHPSAGLSFEKLDLPHAEPLRLELDDFLHAVQYRAAPRVPAQAARDALALALDITSAIKQHAARAQL